MTRRIRRLAPLLLLGWLLGTAAYWLLGTAAYWLLDTRHAPGRRW